MNNLWLDKAMIEENEKFEAYADSQRQAIFRARLIQDWKTMYQLLFGDLETDSGITSLMIERNRKLMKEKNELLEICERIKTILEDGSRDDFMPTVHHDLVELLQEIH